MKLANVLAMACILGLVGYVMAADEPTTKPKGPRGVTGKIVKIDGDKITVKTHARKGAEGKEVVVTTDDNTVFTLDGKDAKLADLKADMYVYATPAKGTATKVIASTEEPKHNKKPSGDKPAEK